jgi:hypothetical protein
MSSDRSIITDGKSYTRNICTPFLLLNNILLLCKYVEHKFPFSLVSEFKHGHNREVTKQGDVSELMDKSIGRLVFRIKGSVSANNYIEFDYLNLTGPIFFIQMCLAKPNIATLHFELLTTTNIPLRITMSTLYNGDQPRFLGRSLRYVLCQVY